MKSFTKCLIILLSATTLLTACAKADGTDPDTTDVTTTTSANGDANKPDSGDTRSLEEIYNAFVGNVTSELPALMQQSVPANRFDYYFGIQKPAGAKDAMVSEPVVGAMPFAITLLRVQDDVDANALAKEIKIT